MSDSIQTAIASQACDPKEPNRQALADLAIQTGDPKQPNRQALADLPIQTGDPKQPNRQALADLPSKRRSERTKRESTFPFAHPDRKESNSQGCITGLAH